jgi:hypothetical protein
MTDKEAPTTPKKSGTVEISVEDLKKVAGGVAQVGLNVVGAFKPPVPPKIIGDVQEGTGI